MAEEVWQNVYDGTDRRLGGTTTEWVIDDLMPYLPRPVISPTCAKRGHDWTDPITPLFKEARVVACKRCMRRGLLVMETRGDSPDAHKH